jgi:hypothetical protein
MYQIFHACILTPAVNPYTKRSSVNLPEDAFSYVCACGKLVLALLLCDINYVVICDISFVIQCTVDKPVFLI